MTTVAAQPPSARSRTAWVHSLRFLYKLPAFVVAGLLWESLARIVDSPYVPPISAILGRFFSDWFSADPARLFFSVKFAEDVLPTLARLAIGWVLAVAISIAAGTALGLIRRLHAATDPLVRLGMAVPPSALLPVAIALFGLGNAMKVFLIAFGSLWPVLLNTIDGVRSIDPTVTATARTLGLGRWRALFAVILPAASPRIFGGLRVSLSTSIILVIIAELYASTSGIGFVIDTSQRTFDILGTWSGVLLLGAIGIVANFLFVTFEHWVMRWQIESRRSSAL
jgi:ABC-type nitrate/sulfonate/bicarbonate transport system permease component